VQKFCDAYAGEEPVSSLFSNAADVCKHALLTGPQEKAIQRWTNGIPETQKSRAVHAKRGSSIGASVAEPVADMAEKSKEESYGEEHGCVRFRKALEVAWGVSGST
jgi:hypothetical protein